MTSNNNNRTVKKYCKICFDAGKPETEYTNHYVRESKNTNGKFITTVVCPTLLALNCRYCHQKGHTVKYCSELQNKKTQESITLPQITKKKALENETKNTQKQQKNMFSHLNSGSDSDSDSENEDSIYKIMPINSNTEIRQPSYAAMVSKVAPITNVKDKESKMTQLHRRTTILPREQALLALKKSWADESESEEEEDEIDNETYTPLNSPVEAW